MFRSRFRCLLSILYLHLSIKTGPYNITKYAVSGVTYQHPTNQFQNTKYFYDMQSLTKTVQNTSSQTFCVNQFKEKWPEINREPVNTEFFRIIAFNLLNSNFNCGKHAAWNHLQVQILACQNKENRSRMIRVVICIVIPETYNTYYITCYAKTKIRRTIFF